MRKTLGVGLAVVGFLFIFLPLASAEWKANVVKNDTDKSLYVIYSTWRVGRGELPTGYRTRGYYRIAPGRQKKFYAWSNNAIYFRISQSGEALKPRVVTETFGFWVHPLRAFTVVSGALTAAVSWDELTYSNIPAVVFVRSDGFMRYANGSTLTVTGRWVAVNAPPPPLPPNDGAGEPEDLAGSETGDGKTLPKRIVTPTDGRKMVLIPAGAFEMGSDDPEAGGDEKPIHTVFVSAFYMDTHEVTNADYQKFVLANPEWQKDRVDAKYHNGWYLNHWTVNTYPVGKEDHPVVYVSWYAAMAYSKWAGKRLPSEAEWEKAARGGLVGMKYPWGNSISAADANYKRSAGNTTTVVGSYPANGYGLYDMGGNVSEWCLDVYDKDFYFISPGRNPLSDVDTIANVGFILNNYLNVKSARVLRGGSWGNNAQSVRVADRYSPSPTTPDGLNGFRCARASVSP